jgi:ATP-dependent protease ClpP protease subunit
MGANPTFAHRVMSEVEMPAVALVFHGPTNYPATKNLRNALCVFGNCLPNQNYGGAIFEKVYLLMTSEGGSIEDALALYNLIQTLPADFTTVNLGQIASAGILPFLAGDERWSCINSYFHFHNLSWTYGPAQTVHRIQMADHINIIDKERELYRAILKENTALTDADFESFKLIEQPLVWDASFAQKKGIVQEVRFPELPKGIPVLNVDY